MWENGTHDMERDTCGREDHASEVELRLANGVGWELAFTYRTKGSAGVG